MFDIGTLTDCKSAIFEGQERMLLTPDDLKTHLLIAGSTGSGKSRTTTQIVLDAFDNGIPAALIDKHGDTADDVGAHLVRRVDETGDQTILSRLDYLEWSPTYCPKMDPFAFQLPSDMHPELLQNLRVAAREAGVDQFATYLNSTTQGTENFDGTPRLLRNLRNGLTACATPAPLQRLAVGLVHVLLNVAHPKHRAVYEKIKPHLPLTIQADFAAIHAIDNPARQGELMESALNRIMGFFTSLLRESFGTTADTAAVHDWATSIRKRRLTLVNLRETPYFSHQQGIVLARFLFSQAIETMMRLPRSERPSQFIVILEEAGETLCEPALRYLGAIRKFGVQVIFCGQDLSTFKKPTFDLGPKLLSQCGGLIIYNQRYPVDAETFSTVLFQSALDYTPLIQEQEVEGEIEWMLVEDTSTSEQHGTNKQKGRTRSHGHSDGGQESDAEADQSGWSKTKIDQQATADGSATGQTRSKGEGDDLGQSPILDKGKVKEMIPLRSQSTSNNIADSDQNTHTVTNTSGQQDGTSGSKTKTKTTGSNWSESEEEGESETTGTMDATTNGKTKRWVHIPHKKVKFVQTGQLKEGPTSEQMQKYKGLLMELPPRHAIVKLAGKPPVLIRSLEVPDAYSSPVAQAKALQWLKRQLLEKRPYLFVPDLDPEQENRRIEEFLAQESEPSCDEPNIIPKPTEDEPPSPFGI